MKPRLIHILGVCAVFLADNALAAPTGTAPPSLGGLPTMLGLLGFVLIGSGLIRIGRCLANTRPPQAKH